MADLIDRDDLFEAMSKYHKKAMAGFDWVRFNEVMQSIVDLPPAQPDVPDRNDGDMISRKAAIDALDGEIEVTGKANAKAVLKYTQMVSDRIKALPSAQSEPRWIPVTERLPKESDGIVLITVSGKVTTGQYSEFSKRWYKGDMCSVGGDDPIAWMPLPTAYERSEDE